MEYGYAGENQLARTASDTPMQQVSIAKEIELKIARLEKQLEVERAMLQLLKDNPAIEQFMNLSRGLKY